MTATYTFDVFSSLDGYGSHQRRRLGRLLGQARSRASSTTASPSYGEEQRDGLRANAVSASRRMLASSHRGSPRCVDPWDHYVDERRLPAPRVVSTTLEDPSTGRIRTS